MANDLNDHLQALGGTQSGSNEPNDQQQDPPSGKLIPMASALPAPPPPEPPWSAAPAARIDDLDEDVISLEAVLQTVRRRKWLLIGIAATVLVLSGLHAFTATPMYRAVALLQVDPEEAKVLPFEEMSGAPQRGASAEEYLWTQAQKLKSGDLAKRVIERMELDQEPGFVGKVRGGFLVDSLGAVRGALSAIVSGGGGGDSSEGPSMASMRDRFLGRLEINPIRNTRLIEIAWSSPDPELSAQVANMVPEEFIEAHLEGKFESTTRATDFLQDQLQDLKVRVESSQEALLAYAQNKGIVNLSDRQDSERKKLTDLSSELTTVQSATLQKKALADAARVASLQNYPDILKNAAIRDLETRASNIEQQLSALSDRYGPNWPSVKEARTELAELQSQLDREKRAAISSAIQDYQVTLDRYQKVAGAVEQNRQQVDRLDQDSIQYNILEREVASNKELYEGLLQRLKEAGVSAGLRSSNIQVADGAEPPRFAASPRKARILVLGLVLGIFLGVGAALGMEMLDNTLKTPEDVTQYLGLPGLGVVPHLVAEGEEQKRWKIPGRRGAEDPDRRPILESEVDSGTRIRAKEAYRTLRTSLMLSHSERPPQVVLVTSAFPNEGKSTTAANLAVSLAATGQRTLLIDADLRKPSLATAFDLSHTQGLSTSLSGPTNLSDQIADVGIQNLYMLPAGLLPPNPPELLGSTRMGEILSLVRDYFSYVVIDSPPSLGLADSRVLAGQVDGVMLVARAGKTPRGAVGRAAEQLAAVGGRILGVVLNDTNVSEAEYGYGGYYGRYGYGKYGYGGYLEAPDTEHSNVGS